MCPTGFKSRQADLSDFFPHENHDYPPALFYYGKIRKPHFKPDFLDCLPVKMNDNIVFIKYDQQSVDGCIIDGAALVQLNASIFAKTYGKVGTGTKFNALT